MMFVESSGRFQPGRLVATPHALSVIPLTEMMESYCRHLHCDWGEVCQEDWICNDKALKNGGRLFSVYRSLQGDKFWIITEADRSVTTILLPEDY